MPEATTEQWYADEQANVRAWRLEQLRLMRDVRGQQFTREQRQALAFGDCDLHEAAALLAAGCTIPTAFKILS